MKHQAAAGRGRLQPGFRRRRGRSREPSPRRHPRRRPGDHAGPRAGRAEASLGLREDLYGSIRVGGGPGRRLQPLRVAPGDNRFEALLPHAPRVRGARLHRLAPQTLLRPCTRIGPRAVAGGRGVPPPPGGGPRPPERRDEPPVDARLPAHREARARGRLGGHRQRLGGPHPRGAGGAGPLRAGPLPPARAGRGVTSRAARSTSRCWSSAAGLARRCFPFTRSTSRDAGRPAAHRVLRGQVGRGLGGLSGHPAGALRACPGARAAGAPAPRCRPSRRSTCATTGGWTCGSHADGTALGHRRQPQLRPVRPGGGFSRAAQAGGLSYEDVILRLVALALSRRQDADTIPLGQRSRRLVALSSRPGGEPDGEPVSAGGSGLRARAPRGGAGSA